MVVGGVREDAREACGECGGLRRDDDGRAAVRDPCDATSAGETYSHTARAGTICMRRVRRERARRA